MNCQYRRKRPVRCECSRFLKHQTDIFRDVWVFNVNTSRCGSTEIGKCYKLNECEKKGQYNERFLIIEQGRFTPLVRSANSGFGTEWTKFYGVFAEFITKDIC